MLMRVFYCAEMLWIRIQNATCGCLRYFFWWCKMLRFMLITPSGWSVFLVMRLVCKGGKCKKELLVCCRNVKTRLAAVGKIVSWERKNGEYWYFSDILYFACWYFVLKRVVWLGGMGYRFLANVFYFDWPLWDCLWYVVKKLNLGREFSYYYTNGIQK